MTETKEKQIESVTNAQLKETIKQASAPRKENPKSLDRLIVKEGVICRKVSGRKPLGAGDSFSASVQKLWCFTRIIGAHKPTKITHVWYFKDTKKYLINLRVNGYAWRTYSWKKVQSDEVGDWAVKVLGPRAEVLKVLDFKITP